MVRRAILLLLVLTAAAGPVRAQEDKADQARSRALFDEGSRAYKSGDYPRAIELFLAAYDLSHAPAILFNVAQAYRLAGECDRALAYYRRSLAEEPEAANRAEVEERIAEMERCAETQQARRRTEPPRAAAAPGPSGGDAAPPSSAPGPGEGLSARAPEPGSSRRSILPLVTAGVGGAAAIAGSVIYLQARARFSEVEATCPCEPGSFSGWETATDVSYVLMGAGALTAGAGLIWWWRESHRAPDRIGVLVPTSRGVAWAGSF